MPLTYTVEIPQLTQWQAAFAKAPETIGHAAATAINQSLVLLQGAAKQAAPVDTGKLRASIQIKAAEAKGNVIQGSVYTDSGAPYALWVERGTGLYGPYQTPIVPVTAKALAFDIGGTKFVRRSVKGMRGRRYMKTAVDQSTNAIYAIFTAALSQALASLTGGAQ